MGFRGRSVALVLLKLALTPALIGLATLVSRRWGPTVGGLLVALPLTSGPVLFFLALENGPAFAVRATEGSLAGATAVAAFSLAYAWAGRRLAWWAALLMGYLAFASMSVAMQPVVAGPLGILVVIALGAPLLGLRLLPARRPVPDQSLVPWWDLPIRMALGAALVLGITAASTALGPQVSGLLATVPVFVTVLAVFTHRREGAARTVLLLHGVLLGIFGTVAFVLVLRLTLERYGIAVAFPAAMVVALGIQALGLLVIRRG